MKVGILTFHRAHNYGAVLQCYALQEVLKGMGHSVEVIDYRQPAIENLYSMHWGQFMKSCVLNPIEQLKYGFEKMARNRRFDAFRTKYLLLSSPCYNANMPDYDAYIIGSDQLWVPELTGGELDKIYSGEFMHPEKSRVIGYAISSNSKAIQKIGNIAINQIVANFYALSFREKEVSDIVGQSTNRELRAVLDPTLLADIDMWKSIDNKKWKEKNYILVYHLPSRFENLPEDNFYKKINTIADREKCDVVSLYPMKYSVEDFVSLLRYANGVVTTSFHATIFSLMFKKKLMYIKTGDVYDVRCVNLLESLSAGNAVKNIDFENEQWPMLDFDAIHTDLINLRKASEKYLINSLS